MKRFANANVDWCSCRFSRRAAKQPLCICCNWLGAICISITNKIKIKDIYLKKHKKIQNYEISSFVLKDSFSRVGVLVSTHRIIDSNFWAVSVNASVWNLAVDCTIQWVPYWPQQNNENERENREIVKRLKIIQCQNTDWKDDFLLYLIMYIVPHTHLYMQMEIYIHFQKWRLR